MINEIKKAIAGLFKLLPNSKKDNAINWAKEVLSSPDYLILDTETTGLSLSDEIVQIGIINLKGEILMDSLIKPSITIPPKASEIHGITDDMVKNAPTFSDVYTQIDNILKEKEIIIYNANFDIKMLGEACRRIERFPFDIKGRSHCAMQIYADYCGSSKWLPLNGGHQAIADCLAVLNLINKMANSKIFSMR